MADGELSHLAWSSLTKSEVDIIGARKAAQRRHAEDRAKKEKRSASRRLNLSRIAQLKKEIRLEKRAKRVNKQKVKDLVAVTQKQEMLLAIERRRRQTEVSRNQLQPK